MIRRGTPIQLERPYVGCIATEASIVADPSEHSCEDFQVVRPSFTAAACPLGELPVDKAGCRNYS